MPDKDTISKKKSQLSKTKQALFAKWTQGKNTQVLDEKTILRRSIPNFIQLSFAQQRLWFLDQLEPGSLAYLIPIALQLAGDVKVRYLQQALQELIKRHESLRTTFLTQDGQPVQVIEPTGFASLPVIDLQGLNSELREQELRRWASQETRHTFDLAHGPLLRTTLLRLEPDQHVLLLTLHHIITDGWSNAIFVRELTTLYRAAVDNQASPLLPLPVQYADYALWQRGWLQGEVLKNQLAYWRTQLDGVAALALPNDHPRPAIQSQQGASQSWQLAPETTQGLQSLSRQENVTLFMLLLASFQVLLMRYSGQSDISVGTPLANRQQTEIENVIGFFVNTLVLRSDLSGNPDFIELLQRVREVCLSAYAHQDLPFEQIVEALELDRDLSRTPLFQVMFILQNTPYEQYEVAGIQMSLLEVESSISKFDLTFTVTEGKHGLLCNVEYNSELFESESIKRLLGHWQTIVQAVLRDPHLSIDEMPLLTEHEHEHILGLHNRTQRDYPQNVCIHQLFEQQVQRTPEAIALVFEEHQLSYEELNQRAAQLAAYLQQQGIGPDVLVGICMERSLEMVVALFAVLKAGGAYLPVDPNYPAERVSFMLTDADVQIVLTHQDLHLALPTGIEAIYLDSQWQQITDTKPSKLPVKVASENLAYVIYTSGSTGKPKGTMNTHRGLANYLQWRQETYHLFPWDRVVQKTPYSFDVSVWEFFWPLLTGASLIMARPEGHRDPAYLRALIVEQAITTLHFVPSMLHVFLQEPELDACRSLRQVMCSGEALSTDLQASFFAHFPEQVHLHNLYGPTEAAIDVTSWACQPEDSIVPIGVPIANTQIYLLDSFLQPVPIGVTAELYIGGVNLARGYLRRAELTAERFIPHPFSSEPGQRLYRSGDLARHLSDGSIEYLGRLDQQVKIRGQRIELGEIETVMRAQIGIEDCIVLAREDRPGEQRLVAYVVKQAGGTLTSNALRILLQERLPSYMVPATFIFLDTLPLTSNGKVDRRTLPIPEQLHPELAEAFVAPSDEVERILAHIWSQLLRVEHVGIHDNFFALGGDSILSIQMVSRARAAGLHLTPKQLFQYQSIAQLARIVSTTSTSQTPQTLVTGPVPLTPIQHWFFERQLPAPQHFNQAILLTTTHPLRLHWLSQTIRNIVLHHDALRLRFTPNAEGWQQEITGTPATSPGLIVDLSGLPEQQRFQVQLTLAESAQAQLALDAGLLLCALYFLHGSDHPAYLLLIIHHLAVDGVSWRILLEDLEMAYGQLVANQPLRLADKTTSWQTWSNQLQQYAQTSKILADQPYWLDSARTNIEPLPQDWPTGDNTIMSSRTHQITLSQEHTQALLHAVPDAYHTQITEVLLTALMQAFARWTGQARLLIDLEGHGREEVDNEMDLTRTVGWFTTLFPVVFECDITSSPIDVLKAVKEQLRQVPHKGMSYSLLRFLTPDPALATAIAEQPQAQIIFNYLGQFDASFSPTSLLTPASTPTGTTSSPSETRAHLLEITANIAEEHLHLNWQYSQEVHQHETIEQLAQWYLDALITLIEQCQAPEAGGYTPSDFQLVTLDQAELDALVTQIPQAQQGRPGQAIEDIYPLSPMQTGLLFHSLYTPEAGVYGNQLEWMIQGAVNIAAWQGAWKAVIQRHAILRTLFVWEGVPQPLQVVLRQLEPSCELLDWRSSSPLAQQERMEQLRRSTQLTSAQLGTAPLLRLALVRLQDQAYTFHLNMHHLITDGWSHALLLTEVQTFYQALCQGKQPALPAVRPYRDYLLWLQQRDLDKAEYFWRTYLQGQQTTTRLPGRTEDTHPHWTAAVTQQVACSTSLTEMITAGAQQQHVTLNTLIQGAWALLLSRYSDDDEVLFGATTTGRPPELSGVETMLGVFINTLPVRVQVSSPRSVGDWLRALQSQQVEAREHEYTPLAQIQTWSELPSGQPFFDSLVVFQNYPEATSVLGQSAEMTLEGSRHEEQTNYPLALLIVPHQNTLVLSLQYDAARFADELISRLLQQLQLILLAFVEQPEQPLERISLLSAQERQQVLIEWNATQRDYPQELAVHQLFEQQVERRPDAVALAFEEQMLTYAELNRRANQLAHHLRRLGVAPDVLVALCLERSLEMVVSLLAVLKAGGAYVPIDPTYPQERMTRILAECQPHVVLSQRHLPALQALISSHILLIDASWSTLHAESISNLSNQGTSANLAYMIYTSGSTGVPKGAGVYQKGFLNLLTWFISEFHLSAHDQDLVVTSFSFDLTQKNLFAPLLVGGCVNLQSTGYDIDLLCQTIAQRQISLLNCTPSMFYPLLEATEAGAFEALKSLRTVFLGGETIALSRIQSWMHAPLFQGEIVNTYGPTECSDVVAFQRLTEAELTDNATIPLGRPIANTQLLILDAHMQLVPPLVAGEIYIAGSGLGAGYLYDTALTTTKFVHNPFAEISGAYLYKTGDLARHRPDGMLEFLGRNDQQVKLRGYRIELGEIESTMRTQTGVEECVVLAREDQPGVKRLVAYVVGEKEYTPTNNQLRAFLQARLPAYMVPAAFVLLDALPLTPNGKVDRRALPIPEPLQSELTQTFVAPNDAAEMLLARIWSQLLRIEHVGVHDNFFTLGGDSILSIQMVSRARAAGLHLTPKQLFQYPSIAQLARVVTATASSQSSQALVTGAVPLTPIQRWFFARQLPLPQHFNLAIMLSTAEPLQLHWLQQALQQLVLHHDALRLRFTSSTDGWQQEIAAVPTTSPELFVDLSGLPEQQRFQIQLTLAESAQAQLDLNAGLLLRSLYFLHGSEHPAYLLLIIHHLAVDGVSWRILLEDLEMAYEQLSSHQPIRLADKTSSWQAWSTYLGQYAQTPQLRADQTYWLDPARTHVQPLPQDLPASETTFASSRTLRVALSRKHTQALLQEVSGAYHTQITEVLLAALVQAVAGWTGQPRVLIDLEGHGREEVSDQVDITRTVGWFTTLFPILLECTSHPIDTLKAVKEQLRHVPHKGLSYGMLRFLTQDPEVVAAFDAQPRAQIIFNYLGQFDASFSPTSLFSASTLDSGATRSSRETRPHLLEIVGSIEGEQLYLSWQYSQEVHQSRTIEDLAQAYLDALVSLIEQCQAPESGGYTPSDFPLLTLSQSELDALVAQIPQAQTGRPGQAIEDIYPLSPMQTGLLFHSLYTPEAGVYDNQFEWIIQGTVNIAAWQEAWRSVIQRHAMLRTLFVWEEVTQPLQVVLRHVERSCEFQDWRSYSPLQQQEQLERLRETTQLTSAQLGTSPLLRLALLRLQDQTYTFHLSMHHLITDGWSQALLLTEVQTYYQALCQGKQPDMPAVRPYRDYLLWLQQHNLAKAEQFWKGYLQGQRTSTRLPGHSEQTTHPHWTAAVTQQIECSPSLTAALTAGAQQQQITLNTLIQGAWALLLSRYSGEDEVLFGATTTGRPPELSGVETMFGVFINTLPIRVHLPRLRAAGDWLRALQIQQIEAREYEYTPLMQIQAWSEIPTGQPLLESLIIFQNYPVTASVLGQSQEMTLEESRHQEQTNFPLVLWIFPDHGTLLLRVQYDETRFEGELIRRLLQQLQSILQAFVEQPEQPLESISLLSTQERQQILVQWNATQSDYPQELAVHQIFEQQVQLTPDAVALIFEEQLLTYLDLDRRANQLARYLQGRGVGPEVLVGLCMERSLEMVVGLLAILKAGGAYVPLDPAYPQERLAFMLQDAQVKIVMSHTSVRERLPHTSASVLYIDQLWTQLVQTSHEQVRWTGSSDQLAYVIYTSGSTGRPKAVMGTHRATVNRFSWMWQTYPFESQEICCQKTNLSFVDAVWEIFGPLVQGVPLVIIAAELVKDPSQLCLLLEQQAITRIVLVPSLLHAILTEQEQIASQLRRLTLWVSSGEPLTVELAQRFRETLPEARLLNLYGSSEVAADVTYYEVGQLDLHVGMAIGRPIANTHIYLLDADMHPVPPDVPGEIYIGGVGVARGYYGQAAITAEKFVPDPFHPDAGARLYRTGDLGRYRSNGIIDYLGRGDQQVKLRGYRIELGEVEAALRAHPSVEDGIVQIREDRPGDARLVAYVVGQPDVKLSSHELRTALHMRVPAYMLPSAFVFLAALPLTPNGKVDRRALPAPETLQVESATMADRDRTPLEDLLIGIWSQVLARPTVGLHENFFEVGGHSLLATRLIGQVRRVVKIELPLRTVFEAPTIAAFAQRIEQVMRQDQATVLPSLEMQARPEAIPLSFAQQRLWFLDQLEPGSTVYLLPIALRIQGELKVSVLEKSLKALVQRHESLRTTFMERAGQAVQVIHAAGQVHVPVLDLHGLSQEQQEREVLRLAEQEAQKSCDLAQGPLLRTTILRLDPDQHVLLLTQHHIITDGWSNSVLVRELTTLYHAFATGQASPLPSLPIQYADYALWQRQWLQGEILEQQMAYWREQLSGGAPLDLPTDYARAALQTFQGRNQTWRFSPQLSEELQSLSQQQHVTLFMLLLASFQVLLMRYSGQNDISVGTPIANRQQAETEDVIGFFVNTLVMRSDLAENPTFAQLLQRVRETCLGAYAHQDLPFEKIVEELSPARDMSRPPLFQVLFVLQNTPQEPGAQTGLQMSGLEIERTTSMFDLTLFVGETEQGLVGTLQYNTDLFQEDTMTRLLRHWQTLLEGVIQNPQRQVREIPLLTAAEQVQVLETWNATQHEYSLQGIHQLFEQQTLRTPDVVAVAFEEQLLTYAELNRRANQLAHYLQQQGVGPETVVGICMERCNEIAVGVLAILKAGGTYLPLDPSYPQQRLAFLLQDAQPAWILTQTALLALFAGLTSETHPDYLALDQPPTELALQSTQNPVAHMSADQLAYVIYTSGSTGRPKGVMLSHQALLNLFTWQAQELPLQMGTRVLQFAPLNFDVSCQELFTTWQSGGTLVILPDDEMRRDPEAVLTILARQQIERIFVPYIALQQLALAAEIQTKLALALRCIITAGEQLQITPSIAAWMERLPESVLYNHYGPSESHVVTSYALRDDPQQWPILPPIGRPIDNTQLYILDTLGQPVPIGIVGELYIGGDNLARGYVGQSILTAERFLPHPFSQVPGRRLYRTGDLARYRSDGNLEFLGRVDQQIKLRGFRIEPGEIEAVLTSFPTVKESIVTLHQENAAASSLVAYLVPSSSEHEINIDELRRFMQGQLPDYMLPSFFISLPALPLTASGKIDRKSLPRPTLDMSQTNEVLLESQTPIQELVAAQWSEVLLQPQISIDANFFALGGHSLLAMQIVGRLRQIFQLELPVRSLFQSPTIRGLAQEIEHLQRDPLTASMPPLVAGDRRQPRVLSFAQERFWLLEQLDRSGTSMPAALRLQGPVDVAALQHSFEALVQRHEILRTTFTNTRGQLIQVIAPTSSVSLPLIDLSDVSAETRETLLTQLVQQAFQQTFDLAHGPLLHTTLLRLGEQEHVLFLTLHHILSDGWSTGLLVRDLSAFYRAYTTGESITLPELPIQYADYALWQRQWFQGTVLQAQLTYWQQQLQDLPELLDLPLDYPRQALQTYQGRRIDWQVPHELLAQIKQLSQREHATLFMTLLASWQILLLRYSGQQDFATGTFSANRSQPELENLIGVFVNTLVLRADLHGNPSFLRLLARVRHMTLDAYAHQDVPFEKLLESLPIERSLSHTALFQVLFTLQNYPYTALELPDLSWKPLGSEIQNARLDLIIEAREHNAELVVSFEYNTSLFNVQTIERMITHWQILLAAIVTHPEHTIEQLPLMTPAEMQIQLALSTARSAQRPPTESLQQLFEYQVALSPDAIAVLGEQTALTYAEVNSRANQLAHYLRRQGVGPDTFVGVALERCPDLIVALLAIFKAGGAYVPLDPSYPVERLALMLDEVDPLLVVTQATFEAVIAPHTTRYLCLDTMRERWENEPDSNLRSKTMPEHLAYMIYTSGSTGKPKGVMIPHANVLRLLTETENWFHFTPHDTWTFFHSYAFDFSVWEIWGALLTGGRLLIVPYAISREPGLFTQLICQEAVTVLNQTPSAFQQLIQAEARETLSTALALRLVIFGGEALELKRLAPWIERHGEHHPQLINMYGITETTVHVTYRAITQQDIVAQPGSVIGQAIPDLSCYVLDEQLQLVPRGIPGELYVGGPGLARGYWQQATITAERFIPHPFSTRPGERLYRTGDRVRLLARGELEYLGRNDQQVKVRGFRIELGEITAVLEQSAEVREALVVLREESNAQKYLVAYIIPQHSENLLTTHQLQAQVRSFLPEYMVPTYMVFLDTWPVTLNGKINTRALPAPTLEDLSHRTPYLAPQTPLQEELVVLWTDVLQTSQVGIQDHFFEVGGNSLLAVQLLNRMQERLGTALSFVALFNAPTIEQQAALLQTQSKQIDIWNPLVTLQHAGQKSPFFCIHPVMGTVYSYVQLAHSLRPDRPFYGLQARGFASGQTPFSSVEEMATAYVQALTQVQPEGPYFLGGHSSGGMVAFEMARQLQAQGSEIALLALLDTVPGTEERSSEIARSLPSDKAMHASILIDYLKVFSGYRAQPLALTYEQLCDESPERQLQIVLEQLKAANQLAQSMSLEEFKQLMHVLVVNQQGYLQYRPGTYHGPLTILRCEEASDDFQARWTPFITQPLEEYIVPGNHFSMLTEPHVTALAIQLQHCIDEAAQ